MRKLIFVDSNEIQKIIDIGEGGGCSDPSKEIWNENTDGPIAEEMIAMVGGLVRDGKSLIVDDKLLALHNQRLAEEAKTAEQSAGAKQVRIDLIKSVTENIELKDLSNAFIALRTELNY